MTRISATEAARRFADLLDAVEHSHEDFVIVRRGRAIAHLEPIEQSTGETFKALLQRHRPDAAWLDEVVALRRDLPIDERS